MRFSPLQPVKPLYTPLYGRMLGLEGVGTPAGVFRCYLAGVWGGAAARCRALGLVWSARSVAPSLSLVCSGALRLPCVLSVRSARSSLPPSRRPPPGRLLLRQPPYGRLADCKRGGRMATTRSHARVRLAHALRSHNARITRAAHAARALRVDNVQKYTKIFCHVKIRLYICTQVRYMMSTLLRS